MKVFSGPAALVLGGVRHGGAAARQRAPPLVLAISLGRRWDAARALYWAGGPSSACNTRQDAVLFCRVTRALHHCGGVQQPAKITSLSSCGPTRCERLATPSLNRCWLTQGWALPCWCSGICSVPPLRPLSVGALLFCLMRRGRARARARAWTHGPAPSATSILFACPANDPSAAFELGLR